MRYCLHLNQGFVQFTKKQIFHIQGKYFIFPRKNFSLIRETLAGGGGMVYQATREREESLESEVDLGSPAWTRREDCPGNLVLMVLLVTLVCLGALDVRVRVLYFFI